MAATEAQLGALPEWLQGLIPVGEHRAASTPSSRPTGFNPFQTLAPLGQGIGGVLTGKPGETGKASPELGLNPFALALMENMAGKNFFTGRDMTFGGGLAGGVLHEVGMGLPQAQLFQGVRGHGLESQTYGQPSAREALLQFLGIPLRELNMRQAQRYANAS